MKVSLIFDERSRSRIMRFQMLFREKKIRLTLLPMIWFTFARAVFNLVAD